MCVYMYIEIYVYVVAYVLSVVFRLFVLFFVIVFYIQVLPTFIRPVHLLRVSLLRVLEASFPGDPLQNSTDMRIPTP